MIRALRILFLSLGLISLGCSIGMEVLGIGSPGFGILQIALIIIGTLLGIISLLPNGVVVGSLVAFFSILVAVVLSEVVLRLTYAPYLSSIYWMTGEYLYKLEPYAKKIFTRDPVDGGQRISVQVNSAGFLGEDVLPKAGRELVMVYGDSFTAAEFSDLPDRFTSRLGVHLEETLKKPIDVINAGVVGYGPDQAYLRMVDEMDKWKPSLVLLAIFAENDFGDLIRNKLFVSDGDGTIRRNTPVLSERLLMNFRYAAYAPLFAKLISKFIDRSDKEQPKPPSHERIVKWISDCKDEYESFIVNSNVVESLFDDHYEADLSLFQEEGSSQLKLQLMAEVFRLVSELLNSKGIPFGVVVIPSPVDLIENYHLGQIDSTHYPQYDRKRLTNFVESQTALYGIPTINLFETFWSDTERNTLYFLGHDNHWSDRGQDVAAQTVAKFILERSLVVKSSE